MRFFAAVGDPSNSSISAEYMVFGRRGIGGPQLAEVNRMLSQERAKAASDRDWLNDSDEHLTRAAAALDKAFAALAGTIA